MNRKTARENAFILLFELASKNDETAEEIFDKAVNIRELETNDFVKLVFFGGDATFVALLQHEIALWNIGYAITNYRAY